MSRSFSFFIDEPWVRKKSLQNSKGEAGADSRNATVVMRLGLLWRCGFGGGDLAAVDRRCGARRIGTGRYDPKVEKRLLSKTTVDRRDTLKGNTVSGQLRF